MRIKIFVLFAVILFTAVACKSTSEEEKPANLDPRSKDVIVQEVIQTTNYTYLKLDEYGDIYWGAVTKMDAEVGETLYYTNSMEMQNFHSEELDRSFETILFIESISRKPIVIAKPSSPHDMNKIQAGQIDVDIEPIQDGITIAELYANVEKYADQTVKIKGKVTKYNPNIMGRNWIHIQDGTENEGNFDLTITTDAEVALGDITVFEGAIGLNKDFGFNYKYDVIMEVASLIKTKSL